MKQFRQVNINGETFNVDAVVPSWPAFWDTVDAGGWEPQTFKLMDRFLTPEWRWVDVGAWIGPTVLYASRKCGAVDAFECDPTALRGLMTNLKLNPNINVSVHDYALGESDHPLQVWSGQFGNSETSIYRGSSRTHYIRVLAYDALKIFRVKGYADDKKTIVKIDVEGSEFVILPRLAELIVNSSCTWMVSFHDFNLTPEGRIGELIRTMSLFERLRWYDMNLNLIDKSATMDGILAGTERLHQPLVFRK